MKISEIIGRTLTINVLKTPCKCRYPNCDILTETVTGILKKAMKQPSGPIGFLEVEGREKLICFDMTNDVDAEIIEIQLHENTAEIIIQDVEAPHGGNPQLTN